MGKKVILVVNINYNLYKLATLICCECIVKKIKKKKTLITKNKCTTFSTILHVADYDWWKKKISRSMWKYLAASQSLPRKKVMKKVMSLFIFYFIYLFLRMSHEFICGSRSRKRLSSALLHEMPFHVLCWMGWKLGPLHLHSYSCTWSGTN